MNECPLERRVRSKAAFAYVQGGFKEGYEAHLQECPTCQDEVKGLRQLEESLRQAAPHGEELHKARRGLDDAIETMAWPRQPSIPGSRGWILTPLAVAAALLLFFELAGAWPEALPLSMFRIHFVRMPLLMR